MIRVISNSNVEVLIQFAAVFFVFLLRDFAANYESILMILFLLGRVDLRGGPELIGL